MWYSCDCKPHRSANTFPQNEHMNGFSPRHLIVCFGKESERQKVLSHNSQRKDFGECARYWWILRESGLWNDILHILQEETDLKCCWWASLCLEELFSFASAWFSGHFCNTILISGLSDIDWLTLAWSPYSELLPRKPFLTIASLKSKWVKVIASPAFQIAKTHVCHIWG